MSRFPSNLSCSLLVGSLVALTGAAQAATFKFPCDNAYNRSDLACVFDSFNRDGVSNNPPILPTFTVASPTTIFAIETYHWNGGAGQDPAAVNGRIALYNHATNQLIGSWPASRSDGVRKTSLVSLPRGYGQTRNLPHR